MFDGNGNIIYLKQYADNYDDEVYEDDFETLDINRINYVIDSLRDAFSGKDIEFEMTVEVVDDVVIPDVPVEPDVPQEEKTISISGISFNVNLTGVEDGEIVLVALYKVFYSFFDCCIVFCYSKLV